MNGADPHSESDAWETVVDPEHSGERFDAYLAHRASGISRATITQAIRDGAATVDGIARKPAFRLKTGQQIKFTPPPPRNTGPEPEDIPLDVLHEDDALIAINKPAGMVVHPAKGHWSGTLTAALAHRFDQLSGIGGITRPGIVHRLDRDTSGVILVAKTDAAHLDLAAQFEHRSVRKQYLAIVRHVPDRDGDVIEQPIGIHPYQREKMTIRADHRTSRPAVTQYEVVERFAGCAVIHAFPKTGRTHQIRVHLAHLGCPVLCDRLYAGQARLTRGELEQLAVRSREAVAEPDAETTIIDRQALHALQIEFDHPMEGQRLKITAPVAPDMQRVLNLLHDIAHPDA